LQKPGGDEMTQIQPSTQPNRPYKRLYTLEEFFAMGEAGLFKNQRVELINGKVIVLPPQGKLHSQAVRRLNEYLVLNFQEKAFVSTQCPLILDGVGKIYVEPDLALLRLPKEQYDTKLVEPSDVHLVIEISDSTLTDDQTEKLELYAKNGVQEYWILNFVAKKLEIHRKPNANTYLENLELIEGQIVTPLAFPDDLLEWW
jgi:Uma2 family endonuclease